jgi:hypothetical protein
MLGSAWLHVSTLVRQTALETTKEAAVGAVSLVLGAAAEVMSAAVEAEVVVVVAVALVKRIS